jgi:menaquinone-dependent protoporphyrinogen oxidase
MSYRILVAYASTKGSTKEVAETIGKVLREPGATVDVLPVEHVTDLNPYNAVVIGSAIYQGKWLMQALSFVRANQKKLQQIPVALFSTSITMREDTPETRQTVLGYMIPVRSLLPQVKVDDIGLFAGMYNARQWTDTLYHETDYPEGDFRQWEAIHDWCVQVEGNVLHQSR